jgi:hypothetical protein
VLVRLGRRRRAEYDVSYDVSTRAKRRDQALVEGTDGRLEVALDHPVDLKILARGDPKRRLSVPIGDFVVQEVLFGREPASGQLGPDHEGVRFPTLTLIAIVLLIRTVEFDELLFYFFEMVRIGPKCSRQSAPKAVALLLDRFDG